MHVLKLCDFYFSYLNFFMITVAESFPLCNAFAKGLMDWAISDM